MWLHNSFSYQRIFFATTENTNWHIAPKKPCSIPQMPGYVSMSITIWKSIVWAMTWPMARFFLPGTYNNSNKTKHKIYMSHAKNRWAKELREKKERKNEPWNCEESLPLRGSRFNKFLISITGQSGAHLFLTLLFFSMIPYFNLNLNYLELVSGK